MLPRRLESLTIHEVDGELLVLDITANRIHQLNRTATLIWLSCDTAATYQEIAERVSDMFDVDLDTALADVERTLANFRQLGLLANS